jgi:hypothetical protein
VFCFVKTIQYFGISRRQNKKAISLQAIRHQKNKTDENCGTVWAIQKHNTVTL